MLKSIRSLLCKKEGIEPATLGYRLTAFYKRGGKESIQEYSILPISKVYDGVYEFDTIDSDGTVGGFSVEKDGLLYLRILDMAGNIVHIQSYDGGDDSHA